MKADVDRIEAAALEFHRQNPHVYIELRDLARRLLAKGRTHYGIGALFEVARFHRALETSEPAYKLNNNYRAIYARMLMENEPDLAGFFDIRERTTAARWEDDE